MPADRTPGVGLPDPDELDDLPPPDGDEGDAPEPEPDYGDLLEDASGEASLDDATDEDAPGDASELALDERESGWLDDAGEANDLDLGEVPIVDFGGEASLLEEADEAIDAEDLGITEGPERGGLDAGEEGPTDADEELREEELPALDADDEGDFEDAALLDASFAHDEPLGVPWSANPWSSVGSPLPMADARAVACAGRGALVVARLDGGPMGLLRVDLEGTCDRLAAVGLGATEVRSISAEGSHVVAVLASGEILASADGGSTFVALAAGAGDALAVREASLVGGRVWACTRAGGLLALSAPSADAAVERCATPGAAVALTTYAASAGAPRSIAVLVADDQGRPAALVRCAAATSGIATVAREMIDAAPPAQAALFAVHGDHVAYAARLGGVVRRLGHGPWTPIAWEGVVTALAFVDGEGTLLCATYSEADDTTALVRIGAAGTATVVARVGAHSADPESDGRVIAMAYDEARGVVWVAGGFGLLVLAVGG